MLSSNSVRTLQGDPILINLAAGDALECESGSIWATLSTKGERSAPTDEFLYPGDTLISCGARTYCVSNMRKQPATFRIVSARRSRVEEAQGVPCGNGYTLHKSVRGLATGVPA
jgi:hypothetical protein